jgi:hypothetical protein
MKNRPSGIALPRANVKRAAARQPSPLKQTRRRESWGLVHPLVQCFTSSNPSTWDAFRWHGSQTVCSWDIVRK